MQQLICPATNLRGIFLRSLRANFRRRARLHAQTAHRVLWITVALHNAGTMQFTPLTSSVPVHSTPPVPTAVLPALSASWQVLQRLPLLEQLKEQALQQLANQFQWRLLEAGQELPHAFDNGCLNLLVSGRMWVRYYGSQGRELLVGDLLPGQWVGNCWHGEVSTLQLTVEAAEPSLVASLDSPQAQALLEREPSMLPAMVHGLNRLVWSLVERVVDMGTLSVRSRLHARLLILAERAGVQDNQALLAPAPTQTTLAALLGSSREEVAREMSRMVRLGLLERAGRGLRLPNVDGLRALLEDVR